MLAPDLGQVVSAQQRADEFLGDVLGGMMIITPPLHKLIERLPVTAAELFEGGSGLG